MNNRQVDIETFFALSSNIPIIDVRSPFEFDHAHIPGAVNLPIFTNDERKRVGICYKDKGREAAVLLGLEIVGLKMVEFAQLAKKLAGSNKLLVHCWRGGMRSSSMSWLFSTLGIETYTLEGGYRSYRRYIKSYFANDFTIVVLGGMTGSGKTEILKEIKKNGGQVIDLEGLANHKGSAFGALGQDTQSTTEQFENNLFSELFRMEKKNPIWLEDESITIGKICIPEELYSQMRNTVVIKVNIPKEERIRWLVKEYGEFDHELLKDSIQRIKKRIGGLNYQLAIEALENNQLEKLVDLVLSYYDKTYSYGLSNRNQEKVHVIDLRNIDHPYNALKILEFYQNILKKY
jgi:tRNA 2-selenouridine synthase